MFADNSLITFIITFWLILYESCVLTDYGPHQDKEGDLVTQLYRAFVFISTSVFIPAFYFFMMNYMEGA